MHSECERITVAVHAGKRGGVISRYASHCQALFLCLTFVPLSCTAPLSLRKGHLTNSAAAAADDDDDDGTIEEERMSTPEVKLSQSCSGPCVTFTRDITNEIYCFKQVKYYPSQLQKLVAENLDSTSV